MTEQRTNPALPPRFKRGDRIGHPKVFGHGRIMHEIEPKLWAVAWDSGAKSEERELDLYPVSEDITPRSPPLPAQPTPSASHPHDEHRTRARNWLANYTFAWMWNHVDELTKMLDEAYDLGVERGRMGQPSPYWEQKAKEYTAALEKIAAGTKDQWVYNIAADAMCWARKFDAKDLEPRTSEGTSGRKSVDHSERIDAWIRDYGGEKLSTMQETLAKLLEDVFYEGVETGCALPCVHDVREYDAQTSRAQPTANPSPDHGHPLWQMGRAHERAVIVGWLRSLGTRDNPKRLADEIEDMFHEPEEELRMADGKDKP